jgi:ADP-ribosylglycohydrolase
MKVQTLRSAVKTAVAVLCLLALACAFAVLEIKVDDMRIRLAVEKYSAQYEIKITESLKSALASRDREIERLNARIDEQWREYYETLEACQPAIRKGKNGYDAIYLPKN